MLPFHGSQNYSLWNFLTAMWLLDLANLLQKWSLSILHFNILISLVQKNNVKREKKYSRSGSGAPLFQVEGLPHPVATWFWTV